MRVSVRSGEDILDDTFSEFTRSSFFNTIETCRPGLILTRLLPFILMVSCGLAANRHRGTDPGCEVSQLLAPLVPLREL